MLLITQLAAAQPNRSPSCYSGVLEYSLPLLTSVPPTSDSQSAEVARSYRQLDQLFRTVHWPRIERGIDSLHWDRTTKSYVAKVYDLIDADPIVFAQWDASAWPVWHGRPLPWNYGAEPGRERNKFQNRIGTIATDSSSTEFLLTADFIADVTISDTAMMQEYSSWEPIKHTLLVTSKVVEMIKGKVIPDCTASTQIKTGAILVPYGYPGPIGAHTVRATSPVTVCYPTKAQKGSCLQFEYIPEPRLIDLDDATPPKPLPPLADSSELWIKPGARYIVCLCIRQIGVDTVHAYFTVKLDHDLFKAMYKIESGRVVDPDDDFKLGGVSLTVADWKSRLRAKIRAIEKYR